MNDFGNLVSIALKKKISLKCFRYTLYIPNLAPPMSQILYPKDHEIFTFGRGLSALHH